MSKEIFIKDMENIPESIFYTYIDNDLIEIIESYIININIDNNVSKEVIF